MPCIDQWDTYQFTKFYLRLCGTKNFLPVLSVVLVDCWGTSMILRCQADGFWHSYNKGSLDGELPVKEFCQPRSVNSPSKHVFL